MPFPGLAAEVPDPASPKPPELPVITDTELPSPGLVVGDIAIRNGNIFDLDDPRENNWLFRLANRLHIRTRPSEIASQLLFRPGDPYDSRRLAESERLLRTNGYIYDARIRPTAVHDNQVDVEVWTRDVWTLQPGLSFSRQGGRNTTSLFLEESNFLGRGVQVTIESTSGVDRDTNSLGLSDAHLFGTRLSAALLLAKNSDGHTYSVRLDRPFYALDTRRAAGVSALDDERIDSLYVGGTAVSRFRTRARLLRAYGGLSEGRRNGWIRRWTLGATWDESRFSTPPGEPAPAILPEDRILAYPWIGFEIIQDRFEEAKNRNQIEKTEDFFLGTHVQASLGYSAPAFGADRRAIPFSAGLDQGWTIGDRDRWVITLNTAAGGRIESGVARDTVLDAAMRHYLRLSRSWLAYASLRGTRAFRLDADHQLLLGGESGLRGYPLRYQAGDRRFLLTLEQRYFTEWYPFRLFRVGAAAFFDMGRAWGGDVSGGPDPGILKDAGAGVRIGSARSSFGNVIHIDVAFPLDGDPSIRSVQFSVHTAKSF